MCEELNALLAPTTPYDTFDVTKPRQCNTALSCSYTSLALHSAHIVITHHRLSHCVHQHQPRLQRTRQDPVPNMIARDVHAASTRTSSSALNSKFTILYASRQCPSPTRPPTSLSTVID